MDVIYKFISSITHLSVELFLVGIVVFIVERLSRRAENRGFFGKDFWPELELPFLNVLFSIPLYAIIVLGVHEALKPLIPYQLFAPQIETLPLLAQAFLGAFFLDFSTYWRHRFTHRFMWPYHSLHHSAEELTWLTSLRLHPMEIAISFVFDLTMLYLLGFDGPGMFGAIILIKFFNYFTHANLDIKFRKPFRYILASPHFHRWHHANIKSAYDKNFCSMYAIIDWAFGTWHHPEELPPCYGLEPQEQELVRQNIWSYLNYPFVLNYRRWRK